MKRLRSFIHSRYPWAIVAGLLLAASFPKIGVAGFAWVAPGLILLAAIGKGDGQAFRLGYVAGLAHYLASLYWLLLIPVTGYPILGWLALGAYLAIYPATWAWLTWKIFPAKFNPDTSTGGLRKWPEQFLTATWTQRMLWVLSGAAAWVAMEMTISRMFSGFPWNLLGASQYKLVPLIQIASVTGVYGVSFLAVWMSLSLLCAGMVIICRPVMRSAWVGEIILPMVVLVAVYGAGYRKLLRPEPKRPQLTVALVQPSIPQREIWDQAERDRRTSMRRDK